MESVDGISVDLDKMKVVMNGLRLTTVIEIHSFLKLTVYYR